MKLRYRFANQAVGVFILLAIAAAVALLVLMGSNQRWFRRNYEYYALIDDARDVSVGMAVTFRGFTIGRVTSISLTAANNVDVRFTIQEEYIEQVRQRSIIQIVSSPLGGGQIVLHQGRAPTPPLPEASRIPTYDSKEALQWRTANEVIVLRAADPIAQIVAQVEPILLNLDIVMANVVELTDEINLALLGQSAGPVAGILTGLESTVAEVERAVARVSVVIDSAAAQADLVLEDLNSITSNLEATTAQLRDPTGLVPRLLDPSGSIATLLDDDNVLFDQITGTVAALDLTIAGLSQTLDELSRFTAYLNTAQPQIATLLEEGRAALNTGQDVLLGLRNNPLLRGGIPPVREQPSTFQGIRDGEF